MIVSSKNTINNILGHLHMRRQGVLLRSKKAPDIDLRDNIKTNLVIFIKVNPSDTNKDKIYSYLRRQFTTMSNKVNRYIYVMYVYYFNATLTVPTKYRSEN